MSELLTILTSIGVAVRDLLLLPGEVLVAAVIAHAPWLAEKLGIVDGTTPFLVQLSAALLPWFLLALAVRFFRRLLHDAGRYLAALGRTALYRVRVAAQNFRTRLRVAPLRLLPRRKKRAPESTPMVEFSPLDLAILRSAAARGPAFTLSAPELAERSKLRPSQIQRSLEKLSRNKMLDHAIGSTDGFDNYRLTDSGVAYITMWQRQQSR